MAKYRGGRSLQHPWTFTNSNGWELPYVRGHTFSTVHLRSNELLQGEGGGIKERKKERN